VYNIHCKVPSAATGLEFEWFSLSLVMKMNSNVALFPIRAERVMS